MVVQKILCLRKFSSSATSLEAVIEEVTALAADLSAADWLGYPEHLSTGSGISLIGKGKKAETNLHFFTGELKCENVQAFGILVDSKGM